jgi:hypothetical protein
MVQSFQSEQKIIHAQNLKAPQSLQKMKQSHVKKIKLHQGLFSNLLLLSLTKKAHEESLL